MVVKSSIVWVVVTAMGASLWGLSWATQSVEIPLWGLFIVTFVPTRQLTSVAQTGLERAETKLSNNTT